MRTSIPAWILFSLVFLIASCINKAVKERSSSFRLSYVYAGLGSGMGRMQPKFVVEGTKFAYTSEQNSYYKNQPRQPADTILTGTIRSSTIDSIIDLVDEITDSIVYRTNTGIMSGGIHCVSIEADSINIQYQLHNASDPTAEEIVKLLNNYIPEGKGKLSLFKLGDAKGDLWILE